MIDFNDENYPLLLNLKEILALIFGEETINEWKKIRSNFNEDDEKRIFYQLT